MYTRYLGTLNEGLFNTKYSLPEGRVLYELATRVAPQANAIAQALGMDPGYLSRLLRKFERAGLLKRKPPRTMAARRNSCSPAAGNLNLKTSIPFPSARPARFSKIFRPPIARA